MDAEDEEPMADDALGKTIKQLKRERTTAKSSFTRQANLLKKSESSMVGVELREDFSKLSECLGRLFRLMMTIGVV